MLFQLKRYKTYAYLLKSRLSQVEGSLAESSIGEMDEDTLSPVNNRYSYRAAIYAREPDIGWRFLGVLSACVLWLLLPSAQTSHSLNLSLSFSISVALPNSVNNLVP